MITVPDWSKAPEDATHFLPETDVYWASWMKEGYSMRVVDQTEWEEDVNTPEEYAAAWSRPCCIPTEEELQLLQNGDYTPEELWGGRAPSCPECAKSAVTYPRSAGPHIDQFAENVFVWYDEAGLVGGATNYLSDAEKELASYAKRLNEPAPSRRLNDGPR
tara:strand:- start:154 stop:636 length:483 start_codon:yes stop_codon:yes gene_type:complete